MEEKKLTDEVLVKALVLASEGFSNLYKGNLYKDTLDLIHRLQDEKKELENLCNKTYDDLTKEIERLTEREKFLENAWHTSIEHTETVERGLNASEARNAELQKQVDALKDERENMQAEIMETEELRLQAVKDAAKEIFNGIIENFVFVFIGASKDYEKGYMDALKDYDKQLRDFAKEKYGVEVE